MTLLVLHAGPLTTVQDLGRYGYQRFGIPVSGAMDTYALRAANLLVGNPLGAAALEIGIEGPVLETTEACLIAVAGAGFDLVVQSRPMPLWESIFVRRGWTIELRRRPGGCWAYLAVAGGIQTPPVLGSRATYLRGQFGGVEGRTLRAGDELPIGRAPASIVQMAGRHIPPNKRPSYSDCSTVEVILGPQTDRFTEGGRRVFLSSEYHVSAVSDRMGYRLEGPAIEHSAGADIISDGLALGSIQVPANGQPLVMMADRPTTGGYPKVATVVGADLPLLAQCPPGVGRVQFKETTVEGAQTRYRAAWNGLKTGVMAPEMDEGEWITA